MVNPWWMNLIKPQIDSVFQYILHKTMANTASSYRGIAFGSELVDLTLDFALGSKSAEK